MVKARVEITHTNDERPESLTQPPEQALGLARKKKHSLMQSKEILKPGTVEPPRRP